MPVTRESGAQWARYFARYAETMFPDECVNRPWNYTHDLCVRGLDQLYRQTGQDRFLLAVLDARPFLLDKTGQIRNFYDTEHNLDKISFGKSLLILYRHTRDEICLQAAMHCYRQLLQHPRTASGGFFHKDIYPYQIWLDGLYMALPFYADCEVRNGTLQFDDILSQFAQVRARLYAADKGLYLHAWDESRKADWADPFTGLSPNVWLRAEGWYLMALCDCYESMHEHAPQADLLAQLLWEALRGLLRWQNPKSGMFLQVVDHADEPGNYPETSGSAMVAYAMCKGARLGMIDGSYAQTGQELLNAVRKTALREEAGELHLHSICASAGLGPGPDNRSDRDGTVRYYLSEKQIPDNQHGAGACMLAYAEALRTADAG